MHDQAVTQTEVMRAICSWRQSKALTPNLVPRAAFQAPAQEWQLVIWLLQRLVGPACLPLRPRLWRERALTVRHKRGPVDISSSFRLLGVMSQHGLLQESILSARVKPRLVASLLPGQSGYIRDAGDAVLFFNELTADYKAHRRCLIAVPADLVRAFPRSWREALIAMTSSVAEINAGALAALGSMLAWDEWLVPLSGTSWLQVLQGIPEGGVLGPLLFDLLPNSLVDMLT